MYCCFRSTTVFYFRYCIKSVGWHSAKLAFGIFKGLNFIRIYLNLKQNENIRRKEQEDKKGARPKSCIF